MTAPENEGRGYGANDLEAMAQKRVRERLTDMRPDLLLRGVLVLQAAKKSEDDLADLRTELHKTVGGDGVRDAMGMLAELAKTAPPKPDLPPMGDADGVPIVGHQIDQMKKTHKPREVSARSAEEQAKPLPRR